jgi:large subunit ribosomal protein L19
MIINSIYKIKSDNKINNYNEIIKFVEHENISNNKFDFNVGDIINLQYNVSNENDKIKLENYEGLIISKSNKSFTLKRNIKNYTVEYVIPINSPKILYMIKKKTLKIRKSKLYFINKINNKKIKFI